MRNSQSFLAFSADTRAAGLFFHIFFHSCGKLGEIPNPAAAVGRAERYREEGNCTTDRCPLSRAPVVSRGRRSERPRAR